MQKALRVEAGQPGGKPEVDFFVQLKEQDPKAFFAALKEEEAKVAAVRKKKRGETGLNDSPHASEDHLPAVSDGYDRTADVVTPMVLAMIDRWLAGVSEELGRAG